MKFSIKVDYACRVLAQLARYHGEGRLAHIDELAAIEEVPANYLVQILGGLREGGLIASRRGKRGGYLLARPPETITLLDIVTLVEGGPLVFGGAAGGQSGKRVKEVWDGIRMAVEARCRSCTLDMLVPRES